MTVCSAAICHINHGPPFIVGACDRMITIGDIEYQPDQSKVIPLATHTVVLLAGEMHVHSAILPTLPEKIKTKCQGCS